MSKEGNVAAAARAFEIGGEFLEARPYGSGHINDTYKVFFNEGGVSQCHILQRINHNIFKKPVALMENIQRVTAHIATRVADKPGMWMQRGITGALITLFRRPVRLMPSSLPNRHFRLPGRLEDSRNCWPACLLRACTIPFRTFTTHQNDSRRLRMQSQQTWQAAQSW